MLELVEWFVGETEWVVVEAMLGKFVSLLWFTIQADGWMDGWMNGRISDNLKKQDACHGRS